MPSIGRCEAKAVDVSTIRVYILGTKARLGKPGLN